MSAELVDLGGTRVALRGELDFSTVCALLPDGLQAIDSNPSLILDMEGVTRANSAGLALLLELLEHARRQGVDLRLANIPEFIDAIARMSNVRGLLPVLALDG